MAWHRWVSSHQLFLLGKSHVGDLVPSTLLSYCYTTDASIFNSICFGITPFFISYGLLCFACCYFAFVKSCVYFRYVLVSTYLNVTYHIGMRRFDMLQEQSLNNYDESSWLLRCRPHHDNIQYRLLIQNSESLSWGFRIQFCPSFPCGWWSGSLFSLVIPFCGPVLCTWWIFFYHLQRRNVASSPHIIHPHSSHSNTTPLSHWTMIDSCPTTQEMILHGRES